jgi:hypothetical protein
MAAPLRRLLPCAATVVAVAAVLRLAFDPWYLNYDARYALLWARDAVRGLTPDYTAPYAPTPHPLETAASVLALPFGADGAIDVMGWVSLLCFGGLVWVTYRVGSELFGTAAGVIAALVVLTRPRLLRDALLGYQDPAFALAVVGAVLLEIRRPRRGAPVLLLLALAGLMRPEAWVLAGLYALYLWPAAGSARRRAGYLALAALAPALWAFGDWLVTGDALHSLHGTSALAEAVGRRRDIETAPYWTAKYFGSTLREPLLIGIPVGLAYAWLRRRDDLRRWAVPVAVAVVMTLVFMAGPLFGLPLIGRYVRTPSVLVTLFFALALVAWRHEPQRRWAVAAAAVALAFLVFLPANVRMIDAAHHRVAQDGEVYADLRAVARAPGARAALATCGPVATADRRPIPYLRWWLDADPGSVVTVDGGAAQAGRLLLVPRRTPRAKRFYGVAFPDVPVPAGWRTVVENRSWRLASAPDCT